MTEPTKGAAAPARPQADASGAATPAGSREALRIGAAVLEVLAGLRSAAEAATALGCSVGRYYQLEQQALKALVAGCEPRPMGRQPSADAELVRLRHENTRLLRECQRQQALVRLARQAAGLAAPPQRRSRPPASGGRARSRRGARRRRRGCGKRRRRRRRPRRRRVGPVRRRRAERRTAPPRRGVTPRRAARWGAAMRGRYPSGSEAVEGLEGTDRARQRLRAILDIISGKCRVGEAATRLDLSVAQVRRLRQAALAGALQALEPHPAGRPRRAEPPSAEATRAAELERRVRELEAELQLSQTRVELACLLPHRTAEAATPSSGRPGRSGRRRSHRRASRGSAAEEAEGGGSGRGARRAPGRGRQRRRRSRETKARREAVSAARAARGAGLSAGAAARALGLSGRTLRRWSRGGTEAAARGRPVVRADRGRRQAVLSWLVEVGGRVGLPALRVRFPELAVAELADLLARFKASWGWRHGAVACALRWPRAGSVWAVDFVKAPNVIDGVGARVLAVRDLGSGMQLAWEAVPDESAASVAGVVRRVAESEGAPLVVKNDNGGAFRSGLWRALWGMLGGWILYSPAWTPGYNGSVEAGNKSLKRRTEAIASAAGRPGEWRGEDLESARVEANARGRPRGSKVAPAVAWECRERVSASERASFGEEVARQEAVVRQQEEARSEGSLMRSVFRRALVALGYLLLTWRRIPLTFSRR